jgi:hypothetical protein
MPRERTDLFRESNVKPKEKIIVLAYEGNNTEAIYFEALKDDIRFNDDLIYLVSLRRPKNDTKSAPSHVFRKLKKEAKEEYNFEAKDELWMVIDRDKWSNIPEIFALCENEGNFYLALSNPCFEFWLLLHLKEIGDFNSAELESIFRNKKVSKKKTYLKQLLNSLLFDGYNESNPKPERFIPEIDKAILRAKALDNNHENYPTGLGSHVYKLAEKLIK